MFKQDKALTVLVVILTMALFLVFIFFRSRIDVNDLALHSVSFVGVDSETGERLNLSVALNGKKVDKGSGKRNAPHWHEITFEGPCRVTWIDLTTTTAVIEAASDGYVTEIIDPQTYTVVESGSLSGPPIETMEIRFKKIDSQKSGPADGSAAADL